MQKKTFNALKTLEEMIKHGNIGASGFLPAERDLCQQFDIGRGALQAVFAELISRKLIRKVPGKGMRIIFDDEVSKSRKFMILIPEGSIEVSEQFEILKGIATAAEKNSAEAVLFFHRGGFIDKRLAARLQDGSLEGVIVMEKFSDELRAGLEEANVPYIVANYEGVPDDIPVTRVDFRQIGRLAGRTLISCGHRRIGFAGGKKSTYLYRELLAGFKGALAEDDIVPDAELSFELDQSLPEEQNVEKVCSKLADLKKSGHAAFFTGRDRYAKIIYKACKKLGLKINEDVSIISYDNITWKDGEKNHLTTIQQPVFQIGNMAFMALCQAVEGNMPVRSENLTGVLVERGSIKKIKPMV